MSSNFMTVIEYRPEHLQNIRAKKVHEGEVPETVLTQAVTVMHGEKPVAIFGAFLFVPGVLHLWGLISDDVKEKPLAFHGLVRDLLHYYEKKNGARRLQMDVKADFIEGQKWARALGFQYEGTMKRYGANGEDFHLYARVT